MNLTSLLEIYLPAIEDEMRRVIALSRTPQTEPLYNMLAYHLGWQGENAGAAARGKRIRPVLVLLFTQSLGANWQTALPAAAAVELLHNFSLIHDDIEDNSSTRRGRATLWTLHGIPQAINAGDALFTLSHLALARLEETTSIAIAWRANLLLQRTCLALTQGQYLDIAYERARSLPLEAYYPMVGGKTAALLAACAELGALCAGADTATQSMCRTYGETLGLAFQIQDDILGIWGDPQITGKSAASDLLAGKKSLPVLYGLQQGGAFAERWLQGALTEAEVAQAAADLQATGAKDYAQMQAAELSAQALNALHHINPQGDVAQALYELTKELLKRKM